MTRRLYVEIEEQNPFGEDIDETVLSRPDRSSTFIPGYSDKRMENEMAALRGEAITPLRHRFQLARRATVSGEDFGQGVQRQLDIGYDIPTYDQLVEEGYDLTKNRAIRKAADGSATIGDTVITWIDAKGAAALWKKNREANEIQENRPNAMMDKAVSDFNSSDVAKRGGMKASTLPFEFAEDSRSKKK